MASIYSDYLINHFKLDREVADYLYQTYGTTCVRVATLSDSKHNTRLHPKLPYLASQILYSCRHELAEKPTDILCRRLGVAYLNEALTLELLPKVVDIMAKEKGWSKDRAGKELKEAQ